MSPTPVNERRKSIASRMTQTSIRIGSEPIIPVYSRSNSTSSNKSSLIPSPSKSKTNRGVEEFNLERSSSLSSVPKPTTSTPTHQKSVERPPMPAIPTEFSHETIARCKTPPKKLTTSKSYTTKRASMVSTPPPVPTDFSHVKSKIGSLDNIKHKPGGGVKKVFDEKVDSLKERILSKVSSKVGSKDNIKHKPGGGEVKIYDDKLEFIKSKEIKSKIGSKDNIKHKPGGGEVKIFDDKLEFIKSKEIKSKVGSKDNIKHKPGGGDVKIYDNKEFLKKDIAPKVGSKDNIKHKPGGGEVKIFDDKLEFIKSKEIKPKVGSLDNIKHKPGGGDLYIYDDKGEFIKSKDITPKVGSLDNVKHKPGGGDLYIYDEKLMFKETAIPRIDAGKSKRASRYGLASPALSNEDESDHSDHPYVLSPISIE